MASEIDRIAQETEKLVARLGTNALEEVPTNAFMLFATERQTRALLEGIAEGVAHGVWQGFERVKEDRASQSLARSLGVKGGIGGVMAGLGALIFWLQEVLR